MNIWILQTGEPLPIDERIQRPMRAMNLSKAFSDMGHNVTIWSSNFDHYNKQFRERKFGTKVKIVNSRTNLRLINSTGYRKNISLMRLIDHLVLGMNLNRELNRVDPPDLAIIGYPPIESSWFMARWLSRRSVPYFLDVKDAWPDIFYRGLPSLFFFLVRVAMKPYNYLAKRTFHSATGIVSISPTFLNWSLKKSGRKKSNKDFVLPLTSRIPECSENELKQANLFWAKRLGSLDSPLGIFVGSLNDSFDFEILDSIPSNIKVEFVIAGNGPNLGYLRTKYKDFPNIHLPGQIGDVEYFALAKKASFYFAPYKSLEDFRMSIPNKIYDAMSFGLPILTSLKGATKNLVIKNNIGLYYNQFVTKEFIDSLNNLLSKRNLKIMGNNSANLYLKQFDSRYVYANFVNEILKATIKK